MLNIDASDYGLCAVLIQEIKGKCGLYDPEYISKGIIIRAATRPSRKCDLMKLSVPFVYPMYADASPKYWNSLPTDHIICYYF